MFLESCISCLFVSLEHIGVPFSSIHDNKIVFYEKKFEIIG